MAAPVKKAAKLVTKLVAVSKSEPEEDEIEELDEVESAVEASEKATPKKKLAKKVKVEKPERSGYSTKEAAAKLGITPVRLRRILRSEDGGFPDKEYTRYDLTDEDLARVAELIASGAAVRAEKKTTAKKSKAKKEEAAAEEVAEELEEIEELSLEEDDEDEDLDSDEDDEEEEEEEEEK